MNESALCQFTPIPQPSHSPWGKIDAASQVLPGIWEVSTPSHGGFIISEDRKAEMPLALRNYPTFCGKPLAYEEDCDKMLVLLAYFDEFVQKEGDELLNKLPRVAAAFYASRRDNDAAMAVVAWIQQHFVDMLQNAAQTQP